MYRAYRKQANFLRLSKRHAGVSEMVAKSEKPVSKPRKLAPYARERTEEKN
jgi:hypothetical protein